MLNKGLFSCGSEIRFMNNFHVQCAEFKGGNCLDLFSLHLFYLKYHWLAGNFIHPKSLQNLTKNNFHH